MKNLAIILVAALAIFTTTNTFAQDSKNAGHNVKVQIPNVALIDIESNGNSTIALAPEAPKEAGEFLDFSNAQDKSLWLNISSVIGKRGKRKITAAITSGSIPGGLELEAQATWGNNKGRGTLGNGVSKVKLSRTPVDIVRNVGTGYTGDGANRGYNLWYGLKLKNNEEIHKINFDQSNTLTVTYTLTDM